LSTPRSLKCSTDDEEEEEEVYGYNNKKITRRGKL
jgi:hypothetical protein